LEILDSSDENFGIGQITLNFHASGKIPIDNNMLNRYNKCEEITYVQFLKNMLGIKSNPKLELEVNELSESKISSRSIEHQCKGDRRTFSWFCSL